MIGMHTQEFCQFLFLFVVDLTAQLQTNRAQSGSLLNQAFHHIAVIHILIIYLDVVNIRIAGHTHDGFFLDGISRIQLGDKMQNQFLTQHEIARTGWNLNQPFKYAVGTWHNTGLGLSALGIEQHQRIQFLVVQERERLLFADNHRHQERRNILVKIGLQQCAFLFGQLIEIDDTDALRLQLAHQLFINPCFFLLQFHGMLQNRIHLLLTGHTGFVFPDFFIRMHLYHQRTYAHHKELVQIGLINRGKGQTLRQRHRFISSFIQHTFIKLQP